MITDLLAHTAVYRSLLPQWDRCFTHLAGLAADAPTGRTDLDGDRLFALVQRYRTSAPETRRFESHERHLDLHYLLEGAESMHVAPTSLLQASGPTNHEKDYTLYADTNGAHRLQLLPGSFALFFPHDGHKTGCAVGADLPVTKVVIKIRLPD